MSLFERYLTLWVFLCIVLFGYPALITVPFAYGLSDLIEGVPPGFLLDWLPGYFINPACFWIAYQFFGKDPDFRRARTWAAYLGFVLIFLAIEPVLWGHLCSAQFTPAISYRTVTPALGFTTGVTWLIAPVVRKAIASAPASKVVEPPESATVIPSAVQPPAPSATLREFADPPLAAPPPSAAHVHAVAPALRFRTSPAAQSWRPSVAASVPVFARPWLDVAPAT